MCSFCSVIIILAIERGQQQIDSQDGVEKWQLSREKHLISLARYPTLKLRSEPHGRGKVGECSGKKFA